MSIIANNLQNFNTRRFISVLKESSFILRINCFCLVCVGRGLHTSEDGISNIHNRYFQFHFNECFVEFADEHCKPYARTRFL